VHYNISEGTSRAAIRVWETSNLQRRSETLVANYESRFIAVDSKGSAAVLGRTFSSDYGAQFVISGYGAKLVDLRSGDQRASYSGHKWPVTAACFVPGGQGLVLASEDGTFSVWDVSGARRLRLPADPSYSVTAIDVSPDGCLLASGEYDLDRMYYEEPKQVCAVRIWNLSTGSLVRTLAPLTTGVGWLRFTSSGRRIVATGVGGTAIWDVRTGEAVATFPTLAGVCGIHPSERYVTAAGSRWIELFDLVGNSAVAVLPSSGQLRAEANGDYLALAMEDGPLLVYRIHQATIEKIPSFITANMKSNYQRTSKRWNWRAIFQPRPTTLISARCPICANQFEPPKHVGVAIASHHIEQSKMPVLELRAEAWDDDRLLFTCPECRRPLRFNPFAS
jgi:WD40 repeat protein